MRLPGLPVDSIAEKTDTHTQNITELYHLYLPVYPSKLTFPSWVSNHCDSAGMVRINNLLEFNPKKKAVIYTYIHQWFQWAKISGGLRRRPKSFTFKPLHQNEETVRKPSVLLLQAPALSSVLLLEVEMVEIMLVSCWYHVGIMLESFPDFPFSSKTSKARLGLLFPVFYVRRTQFVLKLIRSGMVWNSKWPAHQCMLAAKNSWSNPALLLQSPICFRLKHQMRMVHSDPQNWMVWTMQKTSALDVDLQPQFFSEVEEAKDGRFWCCPGYRRYAGTLDVKSNKSQMKN